MSLKHRIEKLESWQDPASLVQVVTELIGGGFECGGKVYPSMDEIPLPDGTRCRFIMPERYETPEEWEEAQQRGRE
ncbi:MAG: hypothetical protein WA081_09810 [Desulfosalsimonadaceae bacterium]